MSSANYNLTSIRGEVVEYVDYFIIFGSFINLGVRWGIRTHSESLVSRSDFFLNIRFWDSLSPLLDHINSLLIFLHIVSPIVFSCIPCYFALRDHLFSKFKHYLYHCYHIISNLWPFILLISSHHANAIWKRGPKPIFARM